MNLGARTAGNFFQRKTGTETFENCSLWLPFFFRFIVGGFGAAGGFVHIKK